MVIHVAAIPKNRASGDRHKNRSASGRRLANIGLSLGAIAVG